MMRVPFAVLSCALGLLGGELHPEPAAADEFAALVERAEALVRRVTASDQPAQAQLI